MYVSRTLETFLDSAMNQFPVLLVTGARQVGKTTLLLHLCRDKRAYVSLDDPLVLSLAREDPPLFLQLLIVQDGTLYPLEIKKTASPGKEDVRHFQILNKLNMPIGPGGVICLAEQSLPLSPSAQSIPVAAL